MRESLIGTPPIWKMAYFNTSDEYPGSFPSIYGVFSSPRILWILNLPRIALPTIVYRITFEWSAHCHFSLLVFQLYQYFPSKCQVIFFICFNCYQILLWICIEYFNISLCCRIWRVVYKLCQVLISETEKL